MRLLCWMRLFMRRMQLDILGRMHVDQDMTLMCIYIEERELIFAGRRLH